MHKVVNTNSCIVIDNYRKPLSKKDWRKIIINLTYILHLQVCAYGV